VREGTDAVLLREGLRPLRAVVADGDEFRFRDATEGVGVNPSYLAAADDGRSHLSHLTLRKIRITHLAQERQRLRHLAHAVHAVLDAHPTLVIVIRQNAEDGVVVIQTFARYAVTEVRRIAE